MTTTATYDAADFEYEVTFKKTATFGRALRPDRNGNVTVLRATAAQADELAEMTGGTVRGPLPRSRHIGRGL